MIKNNTMNKKAPVMSKIKNIKINLMCTTRPVTKKVKMKSK